MTHTNSAAVARDAAWSSADDVDISRYVAAVRRRGVLFSAVAGLVILIVLALMLGQKPLYTAAANLQINTRKAQIVAGEAVLSSLDAETAVVDTEVEVLKSPELAANVVDALDLARDREFNVRLRRSRFSPGWIRRATDLQVERQHVIDAVSRRLTVRRVGPTYSMTVQFTSESPMQAARIANAFADLYLRSQLTAKFDANSRANAFLREKLEELRRQLASADAAVATYRIDNGLLSTQGATLTEQEISAYNQQLAVARLQLAEQEGRLDAARAQIIAGSDGDDIGDALSSPVIQNLRSQRALVSARLADFSVRYAPLHPETLRAQQALVDVDLQIQSEIRRIMSNLNAQVEIARRRVVSMQTSLEAARQALADSNAASVRLRELEGEAEAARAVYRAFLDRYRETSAQTGVEQADARIVSRAASPTRHSTPKIMVSLVLAVIMGTSAGSIAVLIAETLQTGLRSSEDVERRLGMAPIGAIPLASSVTEADERGLHPIDVVVHHPTSVFAEAFLVLRASVTPLASDASGHVVAVASSTAGEGKTTTAICLARVAAASGGRVLLIDGDRRRRGVTRTLGLDPASGLVEAVRDPSLWSDVVVLDPASGAYILPLSSTGSSADDLFGARSMDTLLTELRQAFDLIVIDTPPVLALADGRILAAMADSVVLLARWRRTPVRTVASAVRILNQSDANTLGVALSQVDVRVQARQDYGHTDYGEGPYHAYYAV